MINIKEKIMELSNQELAKIVLDNNPCEMLHIMFKENYGRDFTIDDMICKVESVESKRVSIHSKLNELGWTVFIPISKFME